MARFWVGGGSSTNWSATANTNWATASGGANNQTVPDNTQDVTFDGAASGNGASVVSANITILSLTFTTGYTNTLTINTAVTLTIAGNFTDRTNHTWVVSGTGAIAISAASTITSNGKTFPGPVTFSGSNTKTLSGNWTITGNLSCATTTTTINKTTNETLTCAGLGVSGTTTGTITLILSGGTWSGNVGVTVSALQFGSGASVTVSGSVQYSTGTITNNGAASVTTTGSTWQIGASTTTDTNGISWNNITVSANSVTVTINSLLTATGTFSTAGSTGTTYAGIAGFNVATYTSTMISTTTQTFKNGVEYIITTAFTAFNSRSGSQLTFTSDDGTLTTKITLRQGATCNVLAAFTRVDASLGRAIWTFNGTLTSCVNIFSITDLSFVTGSNKVIHAGAAY